MTYLKQKFKKESKIFVAGHTGLVGSAIVRKLKSKGYNNFVFRDLHELDLTNQQETADFFISEKPEIVFDAAAKVGGILANNTYRAQFIYENIMIQNNLIHQSYVHGVKKLLFLGSSCIYPKLAPQPMKEEYFLTGLLEITNEPYAIAKISGIKMCESYHDQYGCNFISVMPTNLYGPNDNYDLEKSHVLPALIRKMHLGKLFEDGNWDDIRIDLDKRPVSGIDGKSEKEEIISMLEKFGIYTFSGEEDFQDCENISTGDSDVIIDLWGTGSPRREFLHVDDLADAVAYIMENVDASEMKQVFTYDREVSLDEDKLFKTNETSVVSHVNIGCGEDITIKDLALRVKNIVGFRGHLRFDSSKPDGTPQKLLDVSKLFGYGWKPTISLDEGVRSVYRRYCD